MLAVPIETIITTNIGWSVPWAFALFIDVNEIGSRVLRIIVDKFSEVGNHLLRLVHVLLVAIAL